MYIYMCVCVCVCVSCISIGGVARSTTGHIALIGLQPHFYESICDTVGRPTMKASANPKYADAQLRKQNYAEFKSELEDALQAKTVAEWSKLFDANGVPNGAVNTLAGAVEEEQLAARGMLEDTRGEGELSGIKVIASPINISGFEKNRLVVRAVAMSEIRSRFTRERTLMGVLRLHFRRSGESVTSRCSSLPPSASADVRLF